MKNLNCNYVFHLKTFSSLKQFTKINSVQSKTNEVLLNILYFALYFVAIFYAFGVLGPAIGLFGGGYLLSIFTDFATVNTTESVIYSYKYFYALPENIFFQLCPIMFTF